MDNRWIENRFCKFASHALVYLCRRGGSRHRVSISKKERNVDIVIKHVNISVKICCNPPLYIPADS